MGRTRLASMISIVFPPSLSSSLSDARDEDAIAREAGAPAREDAATRAMVRNMLWGEAGRRDGEEDERLVGRVSKE